MKTERVGYNNGQFPNDVRNIRVSDYKDVLNVGNLVEIENKKWIVMDKGDSKCTVMDFNGNMKRYYYKCIDYMYLTKETSCDADIISFMKKLNLNSHSIIDFDNNEKQYRCKDGSLHSYSFLFNKYLRQAKQMV